MIEAKSEIQLTSDGSATIYLPDIDEHYHSVKGAFAESRHVYVECGLRHRMSLTSNAVTTVLEVGFGTGLNCALSVPCATENAPVRYVGLELHPLSESVAGQLHYEDCAPFYRAVNSALWDVAEDITPWFRLEKRRTDFLKCELPQGVDVVYFDAFAPEKQPEMWSQECFARVFDAMNDGGVLVTYCAKGVVRRMLQSVGFVVERLAGPVGGKREILRCTKP